MSNDLNTQSKISEIRRTDDRRNFGNPLLWLDGPSLSNALTSFRTGYLRGAATLWDIIEKRDDILTSVIPKRKSSVARLAWEVVPRDDAPEKTAQAHRDVLLRFYNNLRVSSAVDTNIRGGVRLLLRQMLDALAKQYSVHEIVWSPARGNLTAEFFHVPLWFFENTTGSLRWLTAPFATTGEALAPTAWLITASEQALMEACSIVYYLKRNALYDQALFSQRFGAGFPVVKTGAAPDSPQWKSAETAVANMAQNLGLVISRDDDALWLSPNGTGAPFDKITSRSDKALAAIWRGADLSTLSQGQSEGASLQGKESEMLLDDDAVMIEEALEHYVSRVVIEWYYGKGVLPAADFRLQRPDRSDKKAAIDIMTSAAAVGCPVSKPTFYEAAGLAQPDEGEEVITAPVQAAPVGGIPAANERPAESPDVEALIKARGLDAADLRAALDRLAQASDPQAYAAALADLSAQLPELLKGDAYANTLTELLLKYFSAEKSETNKKADLSA